MGGKFRLAPLFGRAEKGKFPNKIAHYLPKCRVIIVGAVSHVSNYKGRTNVKRGETVQKGKVVELSK